MLELRPTVCALCRTPGNSTELYPANFDLAALNPASFSARRLPDHVHFRIVRCKQCGLVRSDPIAAPEILEHLYVRSDFTYGAELNNLKHTYGRYLRKLDAFGVAKNSLLEIGCGNGFFLEEALAQGWRQVAGVEPSRAAIEQASPTVKPHILHGFMQAGSFPPETFDLVCMFHVYDHLPDPASVLRACLTVLRPGGLLLALNHNVDALSATLLKERSPIIDIEHTYLWNFRTMRLGFEAAGFEVLDRGTVFNRYSLTYLVQLLPMSLACKQGLLQRSRQWKIGSWHLTLPLGNLYMVGRKRSRTPTAAHE